MMKNDTIEQFKGIVKEMNTYIKNIKNVREEIDIKKYLLDNGHWNIKKILLMNPNDFELFISDLNEGCIEYSNILGRNFEQNHKNIKLMNEELDDYLFDVDFQKLPNSKKKTVLNCMIITVCHCLFYYKLQILYYKYHREEYFTDDLFFDFIEYIQKIIQAILLTEISLEDRKQLWNKIDIIFTK